MTPRYNVFGFYFYRFLQNKAIRFIMKSSLRQKIAPLFCKLKILKVQDLFTHEIEKIMHQYTLEILPVCFKIILRILPN